MSRSITPDVHWIRECLDTAVFGDDPTDVPDWGRPGAQVHNSDNAYLITGEDTVLFDTLSPASKEQILRELEDILDGQTLDYVIPSHPETPHAGNTLAVLNQYPDATIIAPDRGSTHELYHLERAKIITIGETLNLGGYEIEFIEPYFLDHGMTVWAFERTEEILFTVDWLGYPHLAGTCLQFADELDRPVTNDQLWEFHGRVFSWYEFADTRKIHQTIGYLAETYGDSILAPAHGAVIRKNSTEFIENMTSVIEQVQDRGKVVKGTIW